MCEGVTRLRVHSVLNLSRAAYWWTHVLLEALLLKPLVDLPENLHGRLPRRGRVGSLCGRRPRDGGALLVRHAVERRPLVGVPIHLLTLGNRPRTPQRAGRLVSARDTGRHGDLLLDLCGERLGELMEVDEGLRVRRRAGDFRHGESVRDDGGGRVGVVAEVGAVGTVCRYEGPVGDGGPHPFFCSHSHGGM